MYIPALAPGKEPCHSPGQGSQGWKGRNSPGGNCATGTVRKELLACLGGMDKKLYGGERELVEPTSSIKTGHQVRDRVSIPQSKL